jgi:hypothetical protein
MNRRDGTPQSQRGNGAPLEHPASLVELKLHFYIGRTGTVAAVTTRLWSGTSGPVARVGHVSVDVSRSTLSGADPVAVARDLAGAFLRSTDPLGTRAPYPHGEAVTAPPEGDMGGA